MQGAARLLGAAARRSKKEVGGGMCDEGRGGRRTLRRSSLIILREWKHGLPLNGSASPLPLPPPPITECSPSARRCPQGSIVAIDALHSMCTKKCWLGGVLRAPQLPPATHAAPSCKRRPSPPCKPAATPPRSCALVMSAAQACWRVWRSWQMRCRSLWAPRCAVEASPLPASPHGGGLPSRPWTPGAPRLHRASLHDRIPPSCCMCATVAWPHTYTHTHSHSAGPQRGD